MGGSNYYSLQGSLSVTSLLREGDRDEMSLESLPWELWTKRDNFTSALGESSDELSYSSNMLL